MYAQPSHHVREAHVSGGVVYRNRQSEFRTPVEVREQVGQDDSQFELKLFAIPRGDFLEQRAEVGVFLQMRSKEEVPRKS